MTAASANTDLLLQQVKQRARTTWSSGDYAAVAVGIAPAAIEVVRRTAISAGERVLDVAAGTGNAAVPAAEAGAQVTALDLTPELFEAGRLRAAEAGVSIEWVEGDAEALPFDDGSFDVVVTTFGAMFAPRHAVAAREMARVLRQGGRLGMATWTPDGSVAEMFRLIAGELPPAPPVADPPLAWGDPEHVRSLFAETGIALDFHVETLPIDPDVAAEDVVDFYVESFGPIVMARRALEPDGRWDDLLARLRPALTRIISEPATYLLTTGTKRD